MLLKTVVTGAALAVSSSISKFFTKKQPTAIALVHTLQPLKARLQRGDGEVEVAVDTLRRGDTVVVHAGEIIPVDGLITHGNGWIAHQREMRKRGFMIKRVGSHVYATELVLVGSIHIAVRRDHNQSS